jgi:hypothetical protein
MTYARRRTDFIFLSRLTASPSPAAAGGSPRVAILNFVIENVISCKNRKKLLKFDHSSSFPLMVPWGKAVTVFIS